MTFSATRSTTWMSCHRKGGWQYICGYPDPGNEDTELGVAVHKYLEWLKSTPGALPDRMTEIGAIAAEALPWVSDLSVEHGAVIEGNFTFQGARHAWQGFKDITLPSRVAVDYKTTGDFKWAKTPEDLLVDPQAVLYAYHEFLRAPPEVNEIELRWLYLRKREPYACKPVIVRMTRAHAMAAFAALESYADEMQAAADAAPEDPAGRHLYVLNNLDPNNFDHCDDYRGCPYQTRCGLPMFREKKKGSKPVNLMDRINAMAALNGGAANAPPAPVVNGPGNSALQSAATVALQTAPVVNTTPSGTDTFSSAFMQPATDAPDEETVEELTDPTPAASAEPAPGQINPPKKGRGRPKGSTNKPKQAEPTVAEAAAAVADAMTSAARENITRLVTPAATPPAEKPVTPAAPGAHRISTLFVGCMPRGTIGELPDFDKLVAKAKVIVGPQDYRLFDYGKGNGLLLDGFKAIVEHEKPSSLVVVDPRSPEAVLCLSYLRGIAESTVEASYR